MTGATVRVAVGVLAVLLAAAGRTAPAPSVTAQPLANPEILEPSVQNEVDHALSAVPEGVDPPLGAAAAAFARLYETNGLTATARAIALVSSQRNGCWFWQGTNVTPVAVRMLREISSP